MKNSNQSNTLPRPARELLKVLQEMYTPLEILQLSNHVTALALEADELDGDRLDAIICQIHMHNFWCAMFCEHVE